MEHLFSCSASRFALAILVIFSIANQGIVNATISKEHHNIQSPLDSLDEPGADLKSLLESVFTTPDDDDEPDDAFSLDSSTPRVKSGPSPSSDPKSKKASPAAKNATKHKLSKSSDSDMMDVKKLPKTTELSADTVVPKKRVVHNFDFDITPGVMVALLAMILSLYIIQWMVSVLMPIKTPNPVPWLRETAADVARGAIPGVVASSARPSRDGQLKLWQNALSTLMVQTFVIGPIAMLAVAVGHYADSDDGLDVDVATFLVVFGACTALSLVFYFFVAATMLCVACSKVASWQQSEMLCLTPDDVVRRYSNAVAEQEVKPPSCLDVCKKEDIQSSIDRMQYLVLRTQVVPFRDTEPQVHENTWTKPFFPLKHEVKDRVAHFDLAQYLTVKLSYVISEMLFIKHWMWLLSGPILLGTVGVQWALNESKLSAPSQIGVEYAEFFLYSLILAIGVLLIHFKLNCIKRHRFERRLQDVDKKVKHILATEDIPGNEDRLDWMMSGTDIMKTFMHASHGVGSISRSDEEKKWLGEPGRMCGDNWLKHLLQLTLVFSSILMSVFCWHIVPLVWTKLGPAVSAVVIAIMISAWLSLVVWVPNVVINLVLLGHCGSRSFDPTVIAKIESEGRARLETGAETLFDCILLNELGKNDKKVKPKKPSRALKAQTTQLFEALSLEGTVDTITLAKWFNANMVRGPVTFSQDFIAEKLGLESNSLLKLTQFSDVYLRMTRTRDELRTDFAVFREAAQDFLLGKFVGVASTATAQGYYDCINRFVRVAEGFTHLTALQRVANENAFLSVAEVFDVADTDNLGECDVDLLVMVIKMYLPDL